jgi:hypothetical protein
MGVPEQVRGSDGAGDKRIGELRPEIMEVAEEAMLVDRDHIEDGAAMLCSDDTK